jgi:hypothetical protein
MKYVAAIIFSLLLAGSATAQSDTSALSAPTSGEVQSSMPAATTGTAPIDTSVPSGTGTTGTSGTTMAEAERHNESNSSFLWVVLAAAVIAALIVLMRQRKRKA